MILKYLLLVLALISGTIMFVVPKQFVLLVMVIFGSSIIGLLLTFLIFKN